MENLFKEHLDSRLLKINKILQSENLDSLFIDSGNSEPYFLDDQAPPFKENPHFLYLCPAQGENHILEIKLDQKPTLHIYNPTDFWHQHYSWQELDWSALYEIRTYDDPKLFWKNTTTQSSQILSPRPQLAIQGGIQLISTQIMSQLNWLRLSKTPYEIDCIRKSNSRASHGHLAAKQCFLEGGSEFNIMMAYLTASRQRESQLPYNNIIALDQHAAILHYQNLSQQKNGQSLLIDAGFRYRGYCSDISRTYFHESAHPVYKDICHSVTALQQDLWKSLRVGSLYPEIQEQAFQGITQILVDSQVIKCNLNDALKTRIAGYFYPHGVGHGLGLQVHDICGKQLSANGDLAQKDDRHPFLRTLRSVQENDVLTIEPGLYFIPQFLEELQSSTQLKSVINWPLVNELKSFGGVRIEDDIWVSKEGPINLTREHLN